MSNAGIIPCLRYRRAPEAIEWLCQAFGFGRVQEMRLWGHRRRT